MGNDYLSDVPRVESSGRGNGSDITLLTSLICSPLFLEPSSLRTLTTSVFSGVIVAVNLFHTRHTEISRVFNMFYLRYEVGAVPVP